MTLRMSFLIMNSLFFQSSKVKNCLFYKAISTHLANQKKSKLFKIKNKCKSHLSIQEIMLIFQYQVKIPQIPCYFDRLKINYLMINSKKRK